MFGEPCLVCWPCFYPLAPVIGPEILGFSFSSWQKLSLLVFLHTFWAIFPAQAPKKIKNINCLLAFLLSTSNLTKNTLVFLSLCLLEAARPPPGGGETRRPGGSSESDQHPRLPTQLRRPTWRRPPINKKSITDRLRSQR